MQTGKMRTEPQSDRIRLTGLGLWTSEPSGVHDHRKNQWAKLSGSWRILVQPTQCWLSPWTPPPPLEKNYHLRGHRESKKWTLDEVLWLILFLPCWIVHIPWLVETCWKKLVPSWSIHILINPSAYSLVEDYNMTEQNNEKLGVCDPLLTEIMLKFPGVRA